jgi:hypothetical protein
MTKFSILSIIWFLMGSTFSHAAPDSLGGMVVKCDRNSVVTATSLDTHHAGLPLIGTPRPVLLDTDSLSMEQMIDVIKERLDHFPAGAAFAEALKEIGPLATWMAAPLDFGRKEALPYRLPDFCKALPAVARIDDVYYADPDVLALVKEAQKGILVAHEALFTLGAKAGFWNSAKVRAILRALLTKDLVLADLRAALADMKQKTLPFESLEGKTYVNPALEWDYYEFEPEQKADSRQISFRNKHYPSDFGNRFWFACTESGEVCTFNARSIYPNGNCKLSSISMPRAEKFLRTCTDKNGKVTETTMIQR